MLRALLSAAARGASSASASAAAAAMRAQSAAKTVNVVVDGRTVAVDASFTVLQACAVAGVEIPRFCFHERLSIAGNCRMCLVEVEKSPKPVASCAMPVMDGMKVWTASEKTKKAREGVMEFLLANHPLDCPICDQGGECDLQDQSMVFGSDRSRFSEYKRAVEDKNIGPLIKTVMTRCIHCTRCVRFATEVAGVEDLGMTGRGNDSQIGTYVEKMFESELSGNVVDLCPVGALTSKPYAFVARSWELHRTPSIDVLDAVGSNLEIDVRCGEVMRVLPRNHDDVNEEWLSDKSRYAVDGLKRQRLHFPMIKEGGALRRATWPEAFAAIAAALRGVPAQNIVGVAGALADCESMALLRDLVHALGSESLAFEDGALLDGGLRSHYLTNSRIAGAETADAVLLIGTNPRLEAPLFNTRLRKAYLHRDAIVCSIGPSKPMNLTYDSYHLGDSLSILDDILRGKHAAAKILANATRAMIVVGAGALQRPDAASILSAVHQLAKAYPAQLLSESWNGINVLHRSAARVGALDLGFVAGRGGMQFDGASRRFVYLLNADDMLAPMPKDAFVVYQGHHGDEGAHRADVVLAGSAYTEKDATYVNTEGRVQRTNRALFAPGEARDDWRILSALGQYLSVRSFERFDELGDVRARMSEISPTFGRVDVVEASTFVPSAHPVELDTQSPVNAGVPNFYMTDPVSRASVTMAKCTAARPKDLVNVDIGASPKAAAAQGARA